MKFRTQFTKNPEVFSPCGDKYEQDYEMRLTPEGGKKLVKKGKRNIYDKIQAHKDEADIYKIIELHDPNVQKQIMDKKAIEALYKNDGDVYDLRDIPKDLVQAKQMLNDAEKKFKSLPTEIKKEFNNNMYEFLNVVKDEQKFTQRMQKFMPKEPEPINTQTQITEPINTQTSTEGGSL